MIGKPALLFYCQHSLGMGHLVRAFGLAAALAHDFQVVFLNGGRFPQGMTVPDGITAVDLPPLGMDEQSQLISLDARYTVEVGKQLRRKLILQHFERLRPAAIVIELFPFGRKKFADEIIPLLEAARSAGQARPRIVCSLRDILVASRRDQQHHDDRAARRFNELFDAAMVHADPAFVRLEESFRPSIPLTSPVHYTGFVTAARRPVPAVQREPCLVVSAGGGIVGGPLFRTAVEAHRLLGGEAPWPLRVVAGPFLPEDDWRWLQAAADTTPRLEVIRSVPDLGSMLGRVAASISQCGYNTAMDILASRVPALVVPFAEGREDEQMNRARRLERLELLRVLDPLDLTPASMAEAMQALAKFEPAAPLLNLDGARVAADLVRDLVAKVARQRSARSSQSHGVPVDELA